MKKIPLTQGKFAVVDDDDFEWLNQWRWYLNNQGYAVRHTPRPKLQIVLMHRVINNTPDGMSTDHVDGDKLNNQRMNLRSCTNAQNMRNKGKNKNNTSGYKGVTWDRGRNKWTSQIMVNGKTITIGRYSSALDAAIAYDDFAKNKDGEFARLNFPDP